MIKNKDDHAHHQSCTLTGHNSWQNTFCELLMALIDSGQKDVLNDV